MKRLLSILLLLLPALMNAQNDYVVVSDIAISGNNTTKAAIIFKELTFGIGDTIDVDRWEEELRLSKENIQNTTLFNFVDIECFGDDYDDNSKAVKMPAGPAPMMMISYCMMIHSSSLFVVESVLLLGL